MPDPETVRATSEKPALAIWGEVDRTLGAEYFLPLLGSIVLGGLRHPPGVGHDCLDDAPESMTRLISDSIQRT